MKITYALAYELKEVVGNALGLGLQEFPLAQADIAGAIASVRSAGVPNFYQDQIGCIDPLSIGRSPDI